MLISSKSNAIIKSIAALHDKKARKAQQKYIVEGIKSVKECIAAGCSVDRVVCVEGLESQFDNPTVVTQSVFKSISDEKTPQGALAVVNMPKIALQPPKKERCLLLDCLQDPGNMGTVIRTANAAGYEEIYAINCVDPYSPKCVRASMSGIFFVKIYEGSKENILSALAGVPIICADMRGENIFSFDPPQKYCLCIGNEGSGISEEIKNIAAYKVKIPMRESCESLNAAVSAGIAMYALKK